MRNLCFLFLLLFSFKGFSQNKILTLKSDLESFADSIPWLNKSTVITGSAHSGMNYSASDSSKPFSFGYKGSFPKACINKNLKIKLCEVIRTAQLGKEFGMVVSVSKNDTTIFYKYFENSVRMKKVDKWTKMEDEVSIPSSLTKDDCVFAFYMWNKNGHVNFDLDDIEISFEEISLPSFLPEYKNKTVVISADKTISIKDYKILFQTNKGFLKITTASDFPLIDQLSIYSEWMNNGKKKGMQSDKFIFVNDTMIEGIRYVNFKTTYNLGDVYLSIYCEGENDLAFNFHTVFNKPVEVYRQALIGTYSMTVMEVYKKNKSVEVNNFKNEYWLDKEGFQLSSNNTTFILYKPENISSIQLNTVNKYFLINADYAADHPLLHFPLMKESKGKYVDHSGSLYAKGDTLKCSFKFFLAKNEVKNVQLLDNPYGFLSSMVFTEHADYTNLRTQRAMYYGSQEIDRPDKATGGFLKFSIPVTKSVFYSNPDKVDNSLKSGLMPGPIATYKETEGFKQFLKQLDESGIEICLHSPDHLTSNRSIMNEALDVIRREFNSITWIDHGYDNSPQSNREDLNCDGTDSSSQFYSADLWNKYGLKYFWNSYFEDSAFLNKYSFNSFFSVPYSGWDDPMPTPFYWRNRRTKDIIHWRTTNTMDPADASLWSYYFSDVRLNDLADNKNNVIIHCYPARVDSTTGFYDVENGIVKSNSEFNNALQKLSSYRYEEKIRLTTIRDLLGYRTSIEDIAYEYATDGAIRLTNKGRSILRGVSFASNAVSVTAGEKEIKSKVAGGQLIFWLDILPGESVNLKLN